MSFRIAAAAISRLRMLYGCIYKRLIRQAVCRRDGARTLTQSQARGSPNNASTTPQPLRNVYPHTLHSSERMPCNMAVVAAASFTCTPNAHITFSHYHTNVLGTNPCARPKPRQPKRGPNDESVAENKQTARSTHQHNIVFPRTG